MADVYRVGIMGLGRSGWNIHAAAIAEHPSFEVVAVADTAGDRQTEARERFGCAVFSDSERVADADLDVVVVATPSHTHVPLALAALEAGKHVVVEKPMAPSAADVDRLIAAASKARRIVTCFQQRRLDPDFLAVRDIVRSGRLGELVLIRRSQHQFFRRTDWQMLRKFGGGVLTNGVPHLLDQVLQLVELPEPGAVDVFADLRHTIGAGDAEDHAKLALRPPKGPLIEIEASYCVALPQPGWLVVGTAGGLTGSPAQGLTARWIDPATLPDLQVDEGPAAGRKYGSDEVLTWSEELVAIEQSSRSQTLEFYDAFADTLANGRDLLVSPESIRRQIALIERARAAAESHQQ